MNRLMLALTGGAASTRLMAAEPGPAGGTAGESPAAEQPAETTEVQAEGSVGETAAGNPEADANPEENPSDAKPNEKPADDKAAEPAKKGDGELNLLDDAAKDGEMPGDEAPSEEAVAEWKKGVKAFDLGDGVEYDDELVEKIAPALMKLTGGDPSKAEAVVKAYTEYALGLNRKAVENEEAFNSQLVTACRERWGKDLGRVARLADAGGRNIFGDKLWNEIRSVRQFANNPDIMERLAAFGRGASGDRGVVTDKGGRSVRRVSLSEQLGI